MAPLRNRSSGHTQVYIISSEDWKDISDNTYKALEVARRLGIFSKDADSERLAGDIRRKIAFLDSGGQLDTRLIAVTDSASLVGPYTLLEGNRRLIAFITRNSFQGNKIYLGYSPDVRHYWWARKTYK